MRKKAMLAAVSVLVMQLAAAAEVLDAAANGFTVKQTLTIKAAPDDVYRRLVKVGDWWDPAHTYSHDTHNLSIEAKPQGCFCEKWPGGGVRHMEVVFAETGKRLVMLGALGPGISLAMTGSLSIELTAAEGGTKLELTYAVVGYLVKGVNTWGPIYDRVLGEQFTRLKNYIETGDPAPKASK